LGSFVSLAEVLFAVLFAWLLLGQLPALVQLAGGALIVAGVALVRADELRGGRRGAVASPAKDHAVTEVPTAPGDGSATPGPGDAADPTPRAGKAVTEAPTVPAGPLERAGHVASAAPGASGDKVLDAVPGGPAIASQPLTGVPAVSPATSASSS
jgi:hypothetical protein